MNNRSRRARPKDESGLVGATAEKAGKLEAQLRHVQRERADLERQVAEEVLRMSRLSRQWYGAVAEALRRFGAAGAMAEIAPEGKRSRTHLTEVLNMLAAGISEDEYVRFELARTGFLKKCDSPGGGVA